MLVLRAIGRGQADYYLRGPGPGRWIGLGGSYLGLEGAVDRADLVAALAGRHPDGKALLRVMPARRRDGFDLIFAAPKSISLLAALSDPDVRGRMELAHGQAVDTALSYLERHATWTRRHGEPTATHGLTAASFCHHWSAAGDPHLHSHLVVANLVQGIDDVWSTLDSRSLYRHARAAGTIFQASLRHGLAEQGFRFSWEIRPSGLADVTGVPRAGIEACSVRHRQIAEEVGSGSGRRARATAAGRTRRAAANGDGEPWDVRLARTGFDRTVAADLVAAPANRAVVPVLPVVPTGQAVEAVLAERLSQFERQDVLQALGLLAVRGVSGAVIERWADDFIATAVAVDDHIWTTPRLLRLQQHVVSLATRPALPPAGVARGAMVEEVLAQRSLLSGARPDAVRRLATGGLPVELLAGPLISQAAVLDAARVAWEASGQRVAVVSQTERGVARWQALTGINPLPPRPGHATVVIVDGADRWPTAALHQVLADGQARNAKVVLVDGGTAPARRRPVSPAVEDLRSRLPAIDCGSADLAADLGWLAEATSVVRGGYDGTIAMAASGPAAMAQLVADWANARAGPPAPEAAARPGPPAPEANARTGPPAPEANARTGPPAPEAAARPGPPAPEANARTGPPAPGPIGPGPAAPEAVTPTVAVSPLAARRIGTPLPTMVALGPEEADFLNTLARMRLQAAGHLAGPAIDAGGRQYQTGDEVRALRRDSRLGSVPGGTVGMVTSVDDECRRLIVQWPDRKVPLTAEQLKGAPLTYAYATTPAYIRGHRAGPVLGLGDPRVVAPGLTPDVIVQVMSNVPAGGGLDPLSRLVAEIPATPRRPDIGADRPLALLCQKRDSLGQRLRAEAPADPRPELRRLGEERAWLAARRAPPGPDLDRRHADLLAAADRRDGWLHAHAGDLRQWGDLTAAIAWREHALGQAAETRASRAVLGVLGPPPPDPSDRRAWRQAATAIEAYRDRWSLPDRPLVIGTDGPDLAGALRVLAGCRAVARTREHDQALTPSGR